MGKTDTKSSQTIFIENLLWTTAKEEADKNGGISFIVSKLLKMWLAREITIILEVTGDKQ